MPTASTPLPLHNADLDTPDVVRLAADFSPYPGGLTRAHGLWSAEALRQDVLEPRLEGGGRLTLDLDEVAGVATSFLTAALAPLAPDGAARLHVTASHPDLLSAARHANDILAERAGA